MNTNELTQKHFSPASENKRATRAGTRALISIAVLLALLITVNVLVSLLPATMTVFDATENGLYSTSATTEKFLSSLKEDVTVYVVCSDNRPEDTPGLLLERYAALSGRVKIKFADPERDAERLADYADITSLTEYSMVVVSDRRSTVVDYDSCRYYQIDGLGEVPASQYTQMVSSADFTYYYYYYYQNYGIDLTAAEPYYGLEAQLTQAIEYVTAESVPHMYLLKGSAEPGTYLSDFIATVQPEIESLDLDSADVVPADAAPLMICAPETDLSSATADKILAYLEKGGKLLLITSPENAAMPNLMRVTESFGVSASTGVLYEGNANNYKNAPTELLPSVNSQHSITYSLINYGYGAPFLPNAHGIEISAELPENVSVTELLTTSASAYTVANDGTETTVGSMAVGIAATDETSGATLFWMSSADALSDAVVAENDQDVTALYYAAMAMLWQSESYSSTLTAIEPVDMSEPTLEITDAVLIGTAAMMIVIIPAVLFVSGIVVRVKRGRR